MTKTHLLELEKPVYRNNAEALKYVKKAIELAPNWPANQAFLVSLYIEINDLPSAECELKKLEDLCKIPLIKPKNCVENYYENIVTGRGSKMMLERIKTLKERIQEAKDLNQHDINDLIYQGVLEFEHFHNTTKAISLLEKAIQIDPLNPKPKFWLAMCYFYDCFRYSDAEKLLKKALDLDPKQPECLSLLAWIIRETDGPINEAIQYVQQALLYAPDWPMLRWQLARLFLLIENVEATENEVQKAFQISLLDPQKITNEVERYYEDVVTGRGWKDIVKDFDHILELIQQTKNDHL